MPLVEKPLADIVTLSRASARTVCSAAALLTSLASGAFAIEYNPATGAVRGMPIEEQRTNLCLWNQQLDNAAWTKSGATVTANAAVAPTGNTTADSLVEDTANTTHSASQNITTAASTTYALSCFVEANGRNAYLRFDRTGDSGTNVIGTFDLTAGTVVSAVAAGSATVSQSGIEDWGGGLYRCWISGSIGANTDGRIRIFTLDGTTVSYLGNGSSGVYPWGVQFEAGSAASSYMGETTTAAITRLADSLTIGTLSPWFNAVNGTIYIEYEPSQVGGGVNRYAISINDGTTNNFIGLASNDATNNAAQRVAVGGTSVVTSALGAASAAITKAAGSYKVNNFAAAINGGSPVTDLAGAVPTVDRVFLMGGGGFAMTAGRLRQVTYYPAIKNTQTLTA